MKEGTIDANGNTIVPVAVSGSGLGNFASIYVKGTWGAGTLTIKASPDNGTNQFDFTDNQLTADGYINIAVKATAIVLVLSGASGPSLTYWVL